MLRFRVKVKDFYSAYITLDFGLSRGVSSDVQSNQTVSETGPLK